MVPLREQEGLAEGALAVPEAAAELGPPPLPDGRAAAEPGPSDVQFHAVGLEAGEESAAALDQVGCPTGLPGRWGSCVRVVDPLALATTDCVELGGNEAALCAALVGFEGEDALVLAVGVARGLSFYPKQLEGAVYLKLVCFLGGAGSWGRGCQRGGHERSEGGIQGETPGPGWGAAAATRTGDQPSGGACRLGSVHGTPIVGHRRLALQCYFGHAWILLARPLIPPPHHPVSLHNSPHPRRRHPHLPLRPWGPGTGAGAHHTPRRHPSGHGGLPGAAVGRGGGLRPPLRSG